MLKGSANNVPMKDIPNVTAVATATTTTTATATAATATTTVTTTITTTITTTTAVTSVVTTSFHKIYLTRVFHLFLSLPNEYFTSIFSPKFYIPLAYLCVISSVF